MFIGIPKKYVYIALILVLIGGFFRFYNLNIQSYWFDESVTVLNVQSIQSTGIARLASGMYYSCPLYCYPTALIANTFGNDPISYRALAVLFGSIFILLIFLITNRMFGLRVALLTTFFTSFSYWQITWSRQARWYTLFECLFWLSIYSFYLALIERKKELYIATAILLPITIIAHPIGYLLPIILIILFILNEINFKTLNWKKVLIAILSLIGIYFFADTVFHLNKIRYLGEDLDFRWIFPQNINFYLRNYWLFFIFSAVALVSVWKTNSKAIWYLTTIFSSYFLFLSLFSIRLNYGHLFVVTPVLYILGSIGIFMLVDKIKTKWITYLFLSMIVVIFFISHHGVLIPKSNYFLESDDPRAWPKLNLSYSVTNQPDWTSAYEYVLSNRQSDEIVISTTPQFNKLFLNEPQYWLSWLGENSKMEKNRKDIYVGATVLHNTNELNEITNMNHGYLIIDGYLGRSNFDSDFIALFETYNLVYYKETGNNCIWVYRF